MTSQGGMPPMAGKKGPYLPTVWTLGGPPEKHIDVPVQSTFLALFAIGAATHMTIFQLNRRRAYKFLPNLFMFVFCMTRIATSILRISSVSLPHDISLAIAASVFVAAGVLILFIINLIFAQRLVRAMHPSVGWHPAFSIAFKALYALIGLTLATLITATVQSFYTLNRHTRHIDRSLQLYGSTLFAIVATLPLPITLISWLVPHPPHDRFGSGRLRTKATTLLVGTTLLSFGALYRCIASWQTPIPRTEPLPGFLGKAPFYVVNFTVEIMTVYLYAIMRVDLRWHIPNGAKGPGSYSKQQPSNDAETTASRLNSEGDDYAEAKIPRKDEMDAPTNKDIDVEKGQALSDSRRAEYSSPHSH